MAGNHTESPALEPVGPMNEQSSSYDVKRWDGAAKTSTDWNSLHRDPELWFRGGNCLVHLYGKGQSRRGPSFRVPFTDLLGAGCYHLIKRFLVLDGPHPKTADELHAWNRKDPRRIVELYIPPPSMADKGQAFHYHVATRNFFAWVFRRSMVGEKLGSALVCLLHSMHEFRPDTEDNVEDMMDYLDEEGYLDFADKPDYALAVLHLAEFFHLKELYIRAFTHCVGMSEFLFTSDEYQHTSLASKKLIRKARRDMDARIYLASDLLKNFLDEELSESYLGIPTGARAHLERFRSFLLSFYTTKLGYFPPKSFDPQIFVSMCEDFAALYELLVDDAYTASEVMPSVAAGGICTLQLIQSFDSRNRFEPLNHPLPLLPQFTPPGLSRRLPWGSRSDRIKPEHRFMAHASLIKASNWRENIFKNDLVRSYRHFEETTIVTPHKADKQETVSLMDARKMRWIMVYAVYQVLRSVSVLPTEVHGEHDSPYHMSIRTNNLPPWEATKDPRNIPPQLLRTQTEATAQVDEPQVVWSDSDEVGTALGRIELKPDIDYFALTHQAPDQINRRGSVDPSQPTDTDSPEPENTSSLTRALSRSSTIRRSMRMFKAPNKATTKAKPPTPTINTAIPPKSPYHEIVVHGYGNGTNNVSFGFDDVPEMVSPVSRRESTVSGSDAGDSGPESLDSVAETADSGDSSVAVSPTSPTTSFSEETMDLDIKPDPLRVRRRGVVSMMMPMSRASSITRRRPVSTICEGSSYSDPYKQLVEEEHENIFGAEEAEPAPPPVPKKSANRHSMILPELRRWSYMQPQAPVVRIRDGAEEEQWRSEEWAAMHAFMDGGDGRVEMVDDDVKPAWEQYADLGGLTEAR